MLLQLFILLITNLLSIGLLHAQNFQESGNASYYHDKFHGRTTASGESYHKDSLTAAHPSLSFGTLVKVTNLSNQNTVIVKINDRGPYHKGRIIDVSKAAAINLGMIKSGTAKVLLEVVETDDLHPEQKIVNHEDRAEQDP